MIRNNDRECEKTISVGQSAAEPLLNAEGSQTMYEAIRFVNTEKEFDMRKSKIELNDFKSTCDGYLARIGKEKVEPGFMIKEVSKKFNISEEWVGKRFRSYYGMSISEKITELYTPTREELVGEILKAKDVSELWTNMGLPYYRRKGLFDKFFGVSNFAKAKGKCIMESFTVSYKPTIQENLSLVCSQVLGDGSYNKVRGAIIITHGEKQINYALYKASLFNKAFPTTKPAGNLSILTHTQGHKYSCWYSGRLPSKICSFIESSSNAKLIEELTPFGIMILCMDDAFMDFDLTKRSNAYLSLYMPDSVALAKLRDVLKTYGIDTTVCTSTNSPGSILRIGTIPSAVMFYKCFIEPFLNEIPECMKYKTILKI